MEDFLAPYRFNHGCGTISAQDGNKEGVAAGGQVVGFADTVEIYSVADGNWRYGMELMYLHCGASPHSRCFVLFFPRGSGYQLGCTVAATANVKNTLQNITNERTPHIDIVFCNKTYLFRKGIIFSEQPATWFGTCGERAVQGIVCPFWRSFLWGPSAAWHYPTLHPQQWYLGRDECQAQDSERLHNCHSSKEKHISSVLRTLNIWFIWKYIKCITLPRCPVIRGANLF